MLPIMQSGMILGSIGSATLSTNTGNFGVSHLLERNTEVSVERVIGITRHDLLEEQHGKGTTPSPSGGIGDFLQHHVAFVLVLALCFVWTFVSFWTSIEFIMLWKLYGLYGFFEVQSLFDFNFGDLYYGVFLLGSLLTVSHLILVDRSRAYFWDGNL